MPLKVDDGALERLRDLIDPPPPNTGRNIELSKPWSPSLGPTQQIIFDSVAKNILAYGEKGSGKTFGLLHKLVRHCYENQNALAVILVPVRSMATKGGAWDKLQNQILPEWKEGLGIQTTDVVKDSQHNEFFWIENRFGGWSQVVLMSAPHAGQLRLRIRGLEPSFVLVDELTSCDARDYWQAVAAQVGRRPGIAGVQQYTAACNPEGPSHWVYKVFFEECFSDITGEWDADFARFHVPIGENKMNLPPGYVEGLIKAYQNDPIEAARMLGGEWIDRPSADALFKDIWNERIHVYPAPDKVTERILPNPAYPVIVGMDPGNTNNAFIFMQRLPVKVDVGVVLKWVVFDEIVHTKRRLDYKVLMPAVIRRWHFWNCAVFGGTRPEFQGKFLKVVWISDTSAFNQFRAAGGSFDVLAIERAARFECLLHNLPPPRVRPTVKFKNSRVVRVKLLMDALGADEVVVSAGCLKLRAALNLVEAEPAKAGEPYDPDRAMTPRKSQHVHPLDAFTYPMLTAATQPALLAASSDERGVSIVPIGTRPHCYLFYEDTLCNDSRLT